MSYQIKNSSFTFKLSLFSILLFIDLSQLLASPLNDTGITRCVDYYTTNTSCPQTNFPGQDAEYGRDATQNDPSDGHAGFSYTKIDMNGNDLLASATSWSCVRDNVSGLVWEVKTDGDGLRDKDWTYTWYNTDTSTNGGRTGTSNGGSCGNATDCDTQKFVSRVNSDESALCGRRDWRMPLKSELLNLRVLDRANPNIDKDYFPNTKSAAYYSASSSFVDNSAWVVYFSDGKSSWYETRGGSYVRLVHSEP